ncbi:hypothetical protein SAMN05421787_101811 [Virgibacillus pantothenticus]|nr:hypothetical protein SAMN05421787_101811 [Virgibacillus pantothenticus]
MHRGHGGEKCKQTNYVYLGEYHTVYVLLLFLKY